jgi:hypothetical protein
MARDEEEHGGRGFKVEDRRRFTGSEEPSATERAEEPPVEETAGADARAPGTLADEPPLAEMSFSTFVMGLTTQALMHLGEIPDPVDNQVARDLPAAKQMIDLLGILREKTKGNLDATEEQLLGSMLYDLRMRYVEMARGR